MVETTTIKANIPGLIDTLVVFIKQEQAKARSEESTFNKRQKKRTQVGQENTLSRFMVL